MTNAKILALKKEIGAYFLKSENLHEKGLYQFFKKEIKSKDIKISHTDVSIIGTSQKKRKYLCALWRPSNYYQTIPWLRIGIPDDAKFPSIEIVLPVFHGDMPSLWSKGKSYFRLGIKYSLGIHGQTVQMFTNSVSLRDMREILEITNIFYRKIKAYDSGV
ncbi:MAG: hypothetical protein OES14_03750 [Nitrosopumilus sp.]|nr:hypothetical protein [Nitrosopumilus sp.]MDH3824885.1 hypothetical protein [Nitrosopumilus sp.]